MKKKEKKRGNKHSSPPKKSSGIFASPVFHFFVIAFLGIAIYLNTFNKTYPYNDLRNFHFDDISNIVENVAIRNINDLSAMYNFVKTRFVGTYTFALNYHFHQLNVFGYHLVNLIIHISASLMAWWLTVLILSTPVMRNETIAKHKKMIALAVGLLFVSHPLQTQAVTYIVQRFASLAALFYLSSLALYIKARLVKKNLHLFAICFAGSAVIALLGVFTKENVVTLPVSILLIEFIFFKTGDKIEIKKDRKKWIYFLPILLFAFIIPAMFSIDFTKHTFSPEHIYYNVFYPRKIEDALSPDITSGIYLMTQFRVIPTYLRLLFIPANQNLDYHFPLSLNFFELHTFLGFLFLTSLLIFALWMLPRRRLISFGIIWFFLTISVESSVLPIRNVIFEHRVYLPLFGFGIFFVSTLYYLFWDKHSKAVIVFFIAVIVINSFLTIKRNTVWKDEITLWSDVIKKSPDKCRPYVNRGKAYILNGNLNKAKADLLKALKLYPDYSVLQSNLGIVYYKEGKIEDAYKHFSEAIRLNTYNVKARYNLGVAYFEQGKIEEAVKEYSDLVNYYLPDDHSVLNNLGKAYAFQGDYDEAVKHLTRALELNPQNADAHFNLANVLQSRGELNEAMVHYREALKINPGMAEAHSNYGAALYKIGKQDEAKAHLKQALRINPDYVEAHNNLGLILYDQDKFDEALKHFSRVVQINPKHATALKYRGHILEMQGKN